MPAATRGHSTTLSILNTTIRRDAEGRFCLNDCHRASGGEPSKRPGVWLGNAQTQALVAELSDAGIPASPVSVVKGRSRLGPDQGTYVVKELVYAYAMWISPAFHLRVIRAFDAMVQGARPTPAPADIVAQHRQAVALFRSMIQAGRLAGMSREDASRSANAAVKARMDIDLLGALQHDPQAPTHSERNVEAARIDHETPGARNLTEWGLIYELRKLPREKQKKLGIVLKGAMGEGVSKDEMWRTAIELGCASELGNILDLFPPNPTH